MRFWKLYAFNYVGYILENKQDDWRSKKRQVSLHFRQRTINEGTFSIFGVCVTVIAFIVSNEFFSLQEYNSSCLSNPLQENMTGNVEEK